LVSFFGNGDNAKGYQLTIAAMSLLGVVMFLICFAGTRERIQAPVNQQLTLRSSLGSLWQNDQWRILCVAAFFLLTGMVLRSTLAIYYVKYYLGRDDLITAFITLGMLGNIAGCATAQWLSRYIDKVKAYIGLQLISAFICVISFFIGSEQLVLAFGMYFLWGFFLQMATPLLWAKMADTVDYGHYKTGVRITGLVYSSIVFFIKLGLALGGAMAGWMLAGYGYQPDVVQSAATQHGILLSFTILPAIGSILVAAVMSCYQLSNTRVLDIHRQLALQSGEPIPEHAKVMS
jgi:GPH family glycoside/pentoside/hexuronide:cation symporter